MIHYSSGTSFEDASTSLVDECESWCRLHSFSLLPFPYHSLFTFRFFFFFVSSSIIFILRFAAYMVDEKEAPRVIMTASSDYSRYEWVSGWVNWWWVGFCGWFVGREPGLGRRWFFPSALSSRGGLGLGAWGVDWEFCEYRVPKLEMGENLFVIEGESTAWCDMGTSRLIGHFCWVWSFKDFCRAYDSCALWFAPEYPLGYYSMADHPCGKEGSRASELESPAHHRRREGHPRFCGKSCQHHRRSRVRCNLSVRWNLSGCCVLIDSSIGSPSRRTTT